MGVGDVGVDLGGGDVGMAEHGLDGAEVGAVHEEVGSKRVAQGVRADVLGDAGKAGVFFDDAFDAAGGDAAEIAGSVWVASVFRIVEKKWGEGIGASIKIIANAIGGGFADENRAIFRTFAANYELATIQIDRAAV